MVEPTMRVQPSAAGSRRPRGRGIALIALLASAAVVGGIAAWQATRPTSRSSTAATGPGRDVAPLIAMIDGTGALVTVGRDLRRTILATDLGTASGYPAWSPDGRRVAAIRGGTGGPAIEVFAVPRGDEAAGPPIPGEPVVIYRSADAPPFYLYWAPDGQRLSFLATEADEVSLRIAPADGSAALDGTGPGAMIRRGVPLYFDWIANDRLLLHVGLGGDAFLGEVGLDGTPVAGGLPGTGEFRSAVVGTDGRFLAFVRGQLPTSELVVAARDGSAEHTLAVAGPAAAVFDPSGTVLAALAADQPMGESLAFPIGPLRLIDTATGSVRTLLDGTVVGFFWSPDGRTIAILRLQAGSGSTTAARPIVEPRGIRVAAGGLAGGSAAASPSTAPTPVQNPEVHLLFVNVADGAVQSDRVVQLGRGFVNQFLPYFDQYALSHRLWAPDSSSLLLPITDEAGRDRLAIVPPDGGAEPTILDGGSGFWSP